MARPPRVIRDGGVYHVLNRRVARLPLFEDEGDFRAFEEVLAEACARRPGVRLLAYVLMGNHWHLLLWTARGKDLTPFMQWLTVTHMRRWHAHRGSTGEGPVYQGRFKSFPVQGDRHLLIVARYVERNALRAGLVRRAEDWAWSSLWRRTRAVDTAWLTPTSRWPVPMPPAREYLAWVNRAESLAELTALSRSLRRGAPFGDAAWTARTAKSLGLRSSLRDPWRPKKRKPSAQASGTGKGT
jgi:putative transposase